MHRRCPSPRRAGSQAEANKQEQPITHNKVHASVLFVCEFILPVGSDSSVLRQTTHGAKVVSDSVHSRVDVLFRMLIKLKTLRTGRGGFVERYPISPHEMVQRIVGLNGSSRRWR